MKVLMLIDDLRIGGAQTHVIVLARELCALGCEVFVASAGGELEGTLGELTSKHLLMPEITRGGAVWKMLRARGILRKYIDKIRPDLVHSHTRRTAFWAHGICRARGIAHIFTAHAKFCMKFPLGALTRYGDGVIAVSEDIKNYFFSQPRVAKVPFCVIENGVGLKLAEVEERLVTTEPTTACRSVGKISTRCETSSACRSIVFVSRVDEDCSRGARLLCEIASRLAQKYADVEITIVGGGAKYSEIRAKSCKINEKVNRKLINVVGNVKNPSRFLREATLFVGVSRAALEAMAHSVPTILLGDEGYLGVFEDRVLQEARRTNLTCRGTPSVSAEQLFADVCRVLDMDAMERRALGAFCYSIVERFYSARSMAERTLAFYRSVLSRPK